MLRSKERSISKNHEKIGTQVNQIKKSIPPQHEIPTTESYHHNNGPDAITPAEHYDPYIFDICGKECDTPPAAAPKPKRSTPEINTDGIGFPGDRQKAEKWSKTQQGIDTINHQMSQMDDGDLKKKGRQKFLRDTRLVLRKLENLVREKNEAEQLGEQLLEANIKQNINDGQNSLSLYNSIKEFCKGHPNMHRENIINVLEHITEDYQQKLQERYDEAYSHPWAIRASVCDGHDTWLQEMHEKSQTLVDDALKGPKVSRPSRDINLGLLVKHAKFLHKIEREASKKIAAANAREDRQLKGRIFPVGRYMKELLYYQAGLTVEP